MKAPGGRAGAARATLNGLLACVVVAAGCAANPPPATTAPGSTQEAVYPGRCALLGVEMVEAPTDRASVDSGSVQVVAKYRPGEGAGAPLGLSFLVRRERVNDLRAHLEQHPNVLCMPKSGEGDSHGYDVQVPPFEGQPGQSKQ
ncbi:MAG: hypothetical protein ACHQ53_08580 [Polyangiales bacterium]